MSRADTINRFKNALRAQFAVGPRYCTTCRCQRPRKGGREIAFNGGLNARWVCSMHGGEQ